MRILKLAPPPPLKILFFSLLAVTASCTVQPNNKNNPNAPSLDANTQEFIKNFQKQKLYVTAQDPDSTKEALIDPKTANITLKSAQMSAFQGDLTFVRSLSPTKAVYRKTDNQYVLLKYDSSGSGAHPAFIQASAPSTTDNFTESTQTMDANGALYK